MPVATFRGVVARSVAAVALSGAVASAVLPAASAASVRDQAAPSSWKVVRDLGGKNVAAFAPVSASSAWVFEQQDTNLPRPTAWLVNGSAVTKYPFPAGAADYMTGAEAAGPDNVWAFSLHQVYAWNGSSWRVMRTFSQSVYLSSVLPLGQHSALLFGAAQTLYYNGTSWSAERSGSGLEDASALSATSAWAVSHASDVAHWNGRTWTKTSLTRLLPPSPVLCHYDLTGIDAVSARNVWVLASGNCQDAGGPLLLLHYNGHSWAKAPLTGTYGTAYGAAADGNGLWLSVSRGAGAGSAFYRYSAGRLTAVKLPVPSTPLILLTPPAATTGSHPVTYLLATTLTALYVHPTAYLLRYGA